MVLQVNKFLKEALLCSLIFYSLIPRKVLALPFGFLTLLDQVSSPQILIALLITILAQKINSHLAPPKFGE